MDQAQSLEREPHSVAMMANTLDELPALAFEGFIRQKVRRRCLGCDCLSGDKYLF